MRYRPDDIYLESDDASHSGRDDNAALFSHLFDGAVVFASGYTASMAAEVVSSGLADEVAFGRMFIANPDLPDRLRHGYDLNAFDRTTSYGGDPKGYTDCPFMIDTSQAA